LPAAKYVALSTVPSAAVRSTTRGAGGCLAAANVSKKKKKIRRRQELRQRVFIAVSQSVLDGGRRQAFYKSTGSADIFNSLNPLLSSRAQPRFAAESRDPGNVASAHPEARHFLKNFMFHLFPLLPPPSPHPSAAAFVSSPNQPRPAKFCRERSQCDPATGQRFRACASNIRGIQH